MTSSLGVHERSARVSLTGVLPLCRCTDHVRCDLVRRVESVGGALGVGQAYHSSHVEEVGTGTRAVLPAPASHHHLYSQASVQQLHSGPHFRGFRSPKPPLNSILPTESFCVSLVFVGIPTVLNLSV